MAARAVDVWKIYGTTADTRVEALAGVTVDFLRGHFSAIMGPSGSGKSTLMHCLAGLDMVTQGEVWIGDTRVSTLGDRALTKLRREQVGFIFQQFNLMPTLTADENITLPLAIGGRKPDRDWMDQVVKTLGIGDRLKHRPTELSGGQQRKVACARALVPKPDVVFADEPTGNLDSRSGTEVLRFLQNSVRELGQTIIPSKVQPVVGVAGDVLAEHPDHTVQTRELHGYLRWRNVKARHPGVLTEQRRERAGIHCEKGIRWAGRQLRPA